MLELKNLNTTKKKCFYPGKTRNCFSQIGNPEKVFKKGKMNLIKISR